MVRSKIKNYSFIFTGDCLWKSLFSFIWDSIALVDIYFIKDGSYFYRWNNLLNCPIFTFFYRSLYFKRPITGVFFNNLAVEKGRNKIKFCLERRAIFWKSIESIGGLYQ